MVVLQNGDTLAVRYTEHVPKIPSPIDHVSVSKQRPHHPLSLYDCLQAFSQRLILHSIIIMACCFKNFIRVIIASTNDFCILLVKHWTNTILGFAPSANEISAQQKHSQFTDTPSSL